MKKFLKSLLLSILVVSLILSFASCNSKKEVDEKLVPELDIELAQKNLKKAGYIISNEENTEPYIEQEFWARSTDENDDPWDNDTISIIEFKTEELAELYYKSYLAEAEGLINENQAFVDFYKFVLSEYEDEMSSDEIDNCKSWISDLTEEIEESKEEASYMGVSGKIFWNSNGSTAIRDTK